MKKSIISTSAFALPLLAFAQQPVRDIPEVVLFIRGIINLFIPLLIAIAVVYVLWGAFEYIKASGDSEKRKEGQNKIVYGIIGVFVMVSIWGLVNILVNSFGFDRNAPTGAIEETTEDIPFEI